MPELVWDKVGERRFSVGVDRGVLYLPSGRGVVWNGLTSVEDSSTSDRPTGTVYLDGIKTLEYQSGGDYSGKLKAFTYPEEFDAINGVMPHPSAEGMFIHEQTPQKFGLSYRTRIGDDVNSIEAGYRLHILYGLSVVPDAITNTTLGEQIAPEEFSWSLSGTPVKVANARPTSHLSFDSTKIDANQLEALEEVLYGSETSNPRLPEPDELIELLTGDYIILIIDHGDGSWSAYGPDERFSEPNPGEFQITDVDATVIDPDTYTVETTYT